MTATLWPNLGYRDARAAIRFLIDAFGFEELAVYEGEDGSSVDHAALRWPGGGFVTLFTAEEGRTSVAEVTAEAIAQGGYPAYSVHIETDAPDALFGRAVAAGGTVVREVHDSPLGTRGFVIADPEGLYWSVGTPLPRLIRDASGQWRPVGISQVPSEST
jgi:uncharacterized glyoxalase superfamily protein PhnB